MPKERDESLYLADIGEAIDRILTYTARGRAAFFADPMHQTVCLMRVPETPAPSWT